MSSHHIVREDQEPALLILNARSISFDKVQELLEWMPTVIVMADQVETVVGWGIKVDTVLVPQTDVEVWRSRLIDQAPVRLITYTPEDDPLIKVYQYLKETNATAINCLLNRTDEILKIELFEGFDMEVFVDNKLWRWFKTGHFEKWIPTQTRLYLLPEHLRSQFPEFTSGSYQVEKDGIVVFNSKHSFWMGEELS
jgi:hypothetical protein